MTPEELDEMRALRNRLQLVEDKVSDLRDERIGWVYDHEQLRGDYERARSALEANKDGLSAIITNYANDHSFDGLYKALQYLEITWED